MYFYPDERLAVFIDGQSLSSSARSLGLELDFRKLYAFFADAAQLTRAYFYAAVPPAGEVSTLRPLLDWLAYNRFTVVTRAVAPTIDPAQAMTVELSVDAMRLAPALSHVVIMSGDGCYRHLAQTLQEMGVRVSVISTLRSRPFVDDDLRRQADQFIDLADIATAIQRGAPSPELADDVASEAASEEAEPAVGEPPASPTPPTAPPVQVERVVRRSRTPRTKKSTEK